MNTRRLGGLISGAALLGALLCLALAQPVLAEEPVCLPVVVPLDGPGFVVVEALGLDAELSCAQGRCIMASEQQLYLENEDQVAAAELRLGLDGCEATLESLSAEGAEVRSEGDAYVVTLAPRAKASVSAAVTASATSAPVLAGTVGLVQLARWGAADAIHIALRWPTLALLQVAPLPDRQSAQTMVWDQAGQAADITWSALNPALSAALAAPTAPDSTEQLSAFLAVLQSATPLSPTYELAVPPVLAALNAAVREAPADAQRRLQLGQTYLALAERYAERRLNYLLLGVAQLEAAAESAPQSDTQAALAAAYYQAALCAHAGGDPESALAYLKRAADIAPSAEIAQAQDDFVLEWGLDLARQGQVAKAITLLNDAEQLPMAQELARYAPPFAYAQTTVTLTTTARTAVYELTLYEPVAADTDAAIQQALASITAAIGPQTLSTVQATGNHRTVTLTMPYQDLGALDALRGQMVEALATQGNLVAELLAAPWRGQIEAWGPSSSWWSDTVSYREQVDTTAFAAAWQSSADYAGWWLVELRARQPAEGASTTAHELALLALREQSALWQQMPDSVHWRYRLENEQIAPAPQWQVSSGETRTLDYHETRYNWHALSQAGAGMVAALGAIGLAVAIVAQKRAKRRRNSHPS